MLFSTNVQRTTGNYVLFELEFGMRLILICTPQNGRDYALTMPSPPVTTRDHAMTAREPSEPSCPRT